MIDALICGKLYGEPRSRMTKDGRTYATAKVRTPMASGESVFVNVVAFCDTAVTALLALQDGDSIALSGELKVGTYADKEGNARPSVDLIAHAVLTEYHVLRRRKAITEVAA